MVQGMSLIEPALAAIGQTDVDWLQVLGASHIALMSSENAVGEVPGKDGHLPWVAPVPTAPMVILELRDAASRQAVELWLERYYPDSHEVSVIRFDDNDAHVRSEPLGELGRLTDVDDRTVVFVPALPPTEDVRTFAGVMSLTRTLRAPGGCPWDRDQTHATLKPHLLEEAYEVMEALDSGDPHLLCEELGDLLFQITIHSQVAAESNEFTIEDVIAGVTVKLMGRHPHVFGDEQLESAQAVLQAWEGFKQREKPKRASILEQIPKGLPALPQSNLIQKRASNVGFEWPSTMDVLDKVEEELEELRREVRGESPRDEEREELGDILFALVSVARHLKIDPEEALRLANRKFAARFQYVESRAAAAERSLRDLSPEELDAYWEEAKALGSVKH